MKNKSILWVMLGLAALATAFGLVSWASAARPVEAGDTPQAVVERFYGWYHEYMGDPWSEDWRNPLADGAYRDSEYLTPGFVARVDGMEPRMFDPFLCAQDVPGRYEVGEAEVRGDTANVPVTTFWTGNPMASRFTVELGRVDGEWRMTGVACTGELVPLTAEQTARAFYDLYLEASQRRNMLVEGAYRHLPFLAPEFVEKVDGIIASFEMGGYDPFLCAQDIPTEVMVGEAEIVGGVARVEVTSSFVDHGFAVELTEGPMGWQIVDIICR
jgi:hypothetical protein